MAGIDRRDFLKAGVLGATALGVGGLVARANLERKELVRQAANESGGYGKLIKTPANNTGEELLAVPVGFQYTVFGKTGDIMSDGLKTPDAHDGMAAFGYRGKVRLIRNHEVRNKPGASIAGKAVSYDETAGGGTTTIEVDPISRLPVATFASLSGTLVNCAGGPTPWGTWISCEETTVGTHDGKVYHQSNERAAYGKDHGYNFEVSVLENGAVKPVPLKAMGRFVHEAVAVDPSTGIVYQTEDTGSAGFYRYIPDVPTKLAEGGRLEMAKVVGKDRYDSRKGQRAGTALEIEWVPIADPDPANATEKEEAVFEQGAALGAMTFARLEGCWYGNGFIYLNSTNGGDEKLGQIWRYKPLGEKRGELVLLFESPNADVMESPDNICVSPRGGLAICEDGGGVNYVRGLTPDGRAFDFLRNEVNQSEFAGACFSPDGETLFVNIQNPGLTLAVWGPWAKGVL
jgi:secreted PhoX family phosphatase